MFSVIISEKGGAERRETFDRTEINVGRVQGNDLMLPKGNVSKRHARLLYRDGRFIVTDLKSTNGTYVNGRKIAQATIVREGDKIYIGDFVLRIESLASTSGISAPAGASAPPPILDDGPPSVDQGIVGEMTAAPSMAGTAASAPPPPPPHPPMPEGPSSSSHPSSVEKQIARPSPRIDDAGGPRGRQLDSKSDASREVISHFPLEHDPDDSVPYVVPGPPKMPAAVPRPEGSSPGVTSRDTGSYPGTPSKPVLRPAPPSSATSATSTPRHASPSGIPPERTTSPSMGMASALLQSVVPGPQTIAAPAPSAAPNTPLRRALPPAAERESQKDIGAQLARRSALKGLLDHVGAEVDFGPLASGITPDNAYVERIDRALGDRVMSMKSRGELPGEVGAEQLVLDARRELLELGPLTPLFDDEEVTEIHLMGHDHVVATHGRRQQPTEVAFTSEAAFERALRRLCLAAGQPLADDERFVERRLARGARLFVVRPTTADQGHMMVVRKPQRADLTLDDLVRSGTISRAIAGLLAQCVAARANVLVTGSVGAGATSMLGALAAAGSTDDRVVVLQEDDELIFNQPHTVSILLGNDAAENARAVQAAARIRPDRLVVGAFAGIVAAEVVDAMGDGVDGVLAASRAPTLRQAVSRLPADLAATRPGIPPETAREWLASAFDLVIEIARLRDGRHRVLRVAELALDHGVVVVRDVFTFSIERTAAGGSVEGAFHPTGIVPGVVEDLVARGVQIDLSIFRRPSQR